MKDSLKYSTLVALTLVIVAAATPSYASSYYIDPSQTDGYCWDSSMGGYVSCGGPGTVDGTVFTTTATGGLSIICRGTYGDPNTYCYINTWSCDAAGANCVPDKSCHRGITSAGYCTCDKYGHMAGSCSVR